MVFILSQKRTIAAYDAIWDEILNLAPDLQKNLKLIHTDFETAAINVFRKKFSRARLVGCWFHFNQVIKNDYSLDSKLQFQGSFNFSGEIFKFFFIIFFHAYNNNSKFNQAINS